MTVYADNAATTALHKSVLDKMIPYLTENYGNPSSLHSIGQTAKNAIIRSREIIADELGCEAREITFTSGGSEADNQALRSAAAIGKRNEKNHIITTSIEHHAILHTVEALKKEGFEITVLPVDEKGFITPEQIEAVITDKTFLVSVMYANNEIGTVEPIKEIGAVCHAHGVLFHTDAVQAAGHLKINVKEENVDFLSLSAHKFNGPKGVGLLYTRKGLPLTNIIYGGAQEKGKRSGTENVASIVGMAEALKEACERIDENYIYVSALRDRLIKGLSAIPHSVLNGDKKNRLPGNVNFCFEGIEGESILILLDMKGICASSGSACTSGSLDPSHVLLAIGRPHEIAHGSLRLSLSADNNEDEIDYIIENVKKTVEHLRNMSPVWRDLTEGKKEYVIQ